MIRHASPSVLALLVACSSGTPADDNNNHTGNSAGFTATIDGTPWAAITTVSSAVISEPGTFIITGSNASGTALSLTLYNVSGPGTYPIGVTPLVFGGNAVISGGGAAWGTPLSGAAGTVTITSVTTNHLVGSFSFDATPTFGSAATKHVTAGHIDLNVTGTGTLTVPDQNGSKLSGTINGDPFNAATIVFGSGPASGTLGIGISNTKYSINLIISGFTGKDTYTLGTASGAVSRTVSITALDGTANTWGYSNGNTSGTFTVTGYTATRMSGSFNITAAPSGGTTTGNATMIGTFDIGFQQLTGLKEPPTR